MRWAAWLTIVCLAGAVSRAGWAVEPVTAGSVAYPAIPCGSLKRFVPADLVVEKLEAVHAETVKIGPAGIVEFPAHCLFRGTLAPRSPYPQVARYAGGDPKDARSFVCKQ